MSNVTVVPGPLPDPLSGAEQNIGYFRLEDPANDLREADPFLKEGGATHKRVVLAKIKPATRNSSKRSKTSGEINMDGDEDEYDTPPTAAWWRWRSIRG